MRKNFCCASAGVAMPCHRGLTHGLNAVEQLLAAFVPDHLTQQSAQQAHLVTQSIIGGRGHVRIFQRLG